MALPKKKVKIVKKPAAKKEAAAAKKKKVMAKKVVTKVAAKKKPIKVKMKPKANAVPKGNKKGGKGKYPYEPYRAKKNVGNAAKNALLMGKSTDDTLEYVMEAFPECNITKNSVGYYRTAIRKEGYDY